jgi:predicted ATPase with chaperone activity
MHSSCDVITNSLRQAAESPNDSPLVEMGNQGYAPRAPKTMADVGVAADVLINLALKLAYTVPRFTTDWAARQLCLPLAIVSSLLEDLRADHLLEVLGHAGPFSYQFAVTNQGREHARRLLEISGYVGPAPVSLAAYTLILEEQILRLPVPTLAAVAQAISTMQLPVEVAQVAGLAMMSHRGLFLHGPAGNGKTTLGHLLHDAVKGHIWIPHCIGIDNNIIRVFDAQCHQLAPPDLSQAEAFQVDQRWRRVERPFVAVGGELTVDALDLIYSPVYGYYEAPLHFKANGGTFLLDDFGCQRVDPFTLLNRWIHPLERGVDFLTLQTGQQLEVPFRQTLLVSTNLDPDSVMSPAFLRRMGYRLFLDNPSQEDYAVIFRRYAARYDIEVPAMLIEHLIGRYQRENRPMKCCEPRDLIERGRDICRYRGMDFELREDIMDFAWSGYFGNYDGRPNAPQPA